METYHTEYAAFLASDWLKTKSGRGGQAWYALPEDD